MENSLIQNFNQFLDALNLCEAGVFSYGEVFRTASISTEDVEKYTSWQADTYSSVPILKKDDFEVFLLCFEPGQETQIHDHNGQVGRFYVVDGELTQEIFFPNTDRGPQFEKKSQQLFGPKMSSEISDDTGFHRLSNQSDRRSICVYVFVKPVQNVRKYFQETDEITTAEL